MLYLSFYDILFDANFYVILGRGFDITFESPKSEGVALFNLGERAYDHLLILPPKSKGIIHELL